jgi:hypothetical protein
MHEKSHYHEGDADGNPSQYSKILIFTSYIYATATIYRNVPELRATFATNWKAILTPA